MLISLAFLDNRTYREFVNNSTNELLMLCKSLATKGTSQATYKERLKLLSTIFKEDTGVTSIYIIDAKCNVLHIVTKLLSDIPSAIEKIMCDKGCTNTDLVSPSIIIKLSSGVEFLQKDLKNYISPHYFDCIKCNGNAKLTRYLGKHLFIDIEMYFEKKMYELGQITSRNNGPWKKVCKLH